MLWTTGQLIDSAIHSININISGTEVANIMPIKMHSILHVYSSVQREPEDVSISQASAGSAQDIMHFDAR